MTITDGPDLRTGTGEVEKNLRIFWGKEGELFWDHSFGFLFSSRSKLQNVNIILLGAFRMPPMPFPMPPLFITDICVYKTYVQ